MRRGFSRMACIVVCMLLLGTGLGLWGCGTAGAPAGLTSGAETGFATSPTATTERPPTSWDATTSGVASTIPRASTTTATVPEYLSWGETGVWTQNEEGDAWEVTLHEPESISDAESGMNDPEANRLVAVRVKITNVGTRTADFTPQYVELKDADGFVYNKANVTVTLAQLASMKVNPGQTVKGYVCFEIPQGAEVEAGLCAPGFDFEPRTWSERTLVDDRLGRGCW